MNIGCGLFTVPTNRWLIGIDLKGIEGRMIAHYASFYDGGEYKDIVLNGDVHSNNARALGCDRETAKTFYYAWLYGAGPGKLGAILGCSVPQAKKKITQFNKTNKGITTLIANLEYEYDAKGYITGLDGRELYIRHKHKLLNTLIQNAATTVFKQWMIECYKYNLSDVGVCHQVLAYHDELGFEYYGYKKHLAETRGKSLGKLAQLAADHFKLKIPVSGESKVGHRYSEVH